MNAFIISKWGGGGCFGGYLRGRTEVSQQQRHVFQDVADEKKRLEHEVTEMRTLSLENKEEIDQLRQQQREVISESGSSEVLNKIYDSAVDKYESLKTDYDNLRKR